VPPRAKDKPPEKKKKKKGSKTPRSKHGWQKNKTAECNQGVKSKKRQWPENPPEEGDPKGGKPTLGGLVRGPGTRRNRLKGAHSLKHREAGGQKSPPKIKKEARV